MADVDMPPRPECEFDFNLPHGIDTADFPVADHDHDISVVRNASEAVGSSEIEELDCDDQRIETDSVNVRPQPLGSPNGAVSSHDTPEENEFSYRELSEGESDEEAGEAFSLPWSSHQAKKSSPKSKKSPRRSDDGSSDGLSPTPKKPRQSLFGASPTEEDIRETTESNIYGEDDSPKHNIGHRMSSLNLEQEDKQRSSTGRPFNFGFGSTSENRESVSPRTSRASSEESIIIPPDDQVRSTMV